MTMQLFGGAGSDSFRVENPDAETLAYLQALTIPYGGTAANGYEVRNGTGDVVSHGAYAAVWYVSSAALQSIKAGNPVAPTPVDPTKPDADGFVHMRNSVGFQHVRPEQVAARLAQGWTLDSHGLSPMPRTA